MRQEKIRPDQHVRVVDADLAETQSGVADLFVADLETRKTSDVGLDRPASDPSAIAAVDHALGIRLDAGACRGPLRQDRISGTRIEHHPNASSVDEGGARGMRRDRRPPGDVHERQGLRRLDPISQIGAGAAVSLYQANDALRQVVFDIADAEKILAEHADAAQAAHLAAADEKLDVVHGDAGNGEHLHGRNRGIDIAADTLDIKPEGGRPQLQLVLRRACRGDHAEKRTAIRDELRILAVYFGRDEGLRTAHGHGQLGHFAELAGGKSTGWKHRRQNDRHRKRAEAQPAKTRRPGSRCR